MSALPPLSSIPTEMIIDYMQKLFAIGDTNGDGVLSPTEFAEVRQQSRRWPCDGSCVVRTTHRSLDGATLPWEHRYAP